MGRQLFEDYCDPEFVLRAAFGAEREFRAHGAPWIARISAGWSKISGLLRLNGGL